MKREAVGQGEFSVGRVFGAATPPGALVHVKKVHVKKVTVLISRRNLWRDLKILVTLRTAVFQLPSKFYENRTVRSAFVQLSSHR